MVPKNLDRRRNRTLGRSKKIPDISVEIMPASAAIASESNVKHQPALRDGVARDYEIRMRNYDVIRIL
jgi:hypothetical protein